MTVAVATEKTAFDKPYDPISSSGMLHFAHDVETLFNDILNGTEAFERQLFTTATQKTIASGAITAPALALHTVAAETGSADELTTISASDNFFVVLKAASGHTITIVPGAGNITSAVGGSVILSGNRAAMLWCLGSQWAIVGIKRSSNNLTATRDPGNGDDIGDGYGVGSLWVNTNLDRVWLCLNSNSGLAVWKHISPWKNSMVARGAGATLVGVGCGVSTVGTSSLASSNDADNTWLALISSLILSQTIVAEDSTSPFVAVRPGHNPVFEAYIKTSSNISSMRVWIGLFNVAPINNNTQSNPLFAFRFTTGTDTGWTPVMRGATTQTAGATIGTVAINTVYKLKIRVDSDNSTAYFSVNDGAETAISTDFPAATTDMSFSLRHYNQVGDTRTLLLGSMEVGW